MAGVAKDWKAHSVMRAYESAGVTCPISGDALRLEQLPWRPAFYDRHRAIEDRELAAERETLW